MIGWLDALRRDDLASLKASLDPEIVWQGLREDWFCHGPDEVAETFASRRDAYAEIGVVELIGADRHAIMHAHGGDIREVEGIPLPDGIYNVFAIEAGLVRRIEDYSARSEALAAAGLESA